MLKSQSFFELHKIVYSQMSSRRVNKIDKKPRDPRHRRRVSNGHGGESVRLPTTPTGKSKKKKENRNWKQRKCVRVTAVDFPFFPSIFHSYLKTYGMWHPKGATRKAAKRTYYFWCLKLLDGVDPVVTSYPPSDELMMTFFFSSLNLSCCFVSPVHHHVGFGRVEEKKVAASCSTGSRAPFQLISVGSVCFSLSNWAPSGHRNMSITKTARVGCCSPLENSGRLCLF